MCATYEIRETVKLFSHFGGLIEMPRELSIYAVEFISEENQYVGCDEGLLHRDEYSEDYWILLTRQTLGFPVLLSPPLKA